MGFLSGQAAQAFTDNFLKTYMAIGEDRRAEEGQKLAKTMAEAKIKEMQEAEAIRQVQMREMNAQAAQREYSLQQDASMQSDMMNLPVSINARGLMRSGIIDPKTQSSDPAALKQVAMGQTPRGLLSGELSQPTFDDKLGVLSKYDPKSALAIEASLGRQKSLQRGVEEKYDSKTHTTYGRDYTFDTKTGEKTYDPAGWRPIKGRESTKIEIGNGVQDRSDRTFGQNLRKEFNNLPDVRESNTILPKIKSMESAYSESKKTNNFVAVDQALITLYNKLTDPNSVVRESEYARTAENIPTLNAIKGKAQKVASGGAGLTADEREALMKMARLMKKGYGEIRGRRVKEYKSYAKDAGLDGDKLFVDSFEDAAEEGLSFDSGAIAAELAKRKRK